MASRIEKYENKIIETNQRGSLKFQYINKHQDQQNNVSMTNRNNDITPREVEEPSLFASNIDFNNNRPSTQANRAKNFINTMRKTNIKYPFNY